MAIEIRINVCENLYLRDPQETALGRRIIRHSILMIDEIGFEQFTFRKLAERIQSTEASIYRYFGNKHLLLVYLLSWYWEWMRYQIDYRTHNIPDAREQLRLAIHTIVHTTRPNPAIDFVDEDILHRVVIAEGDKAYHTKEVDQENKQGFFVTYKSLVRSLGEIVLRIRPDYPYPKALATTLLEMTQDHLYYAKHLPSLTEVTVPNSDLTEMEDLLQHFAFGLIDGNRKA